MTKRSRAASPDIDSLSRDEVLKRMLKMKPQPHVPRGKSKVAKTKDSKTKDALHRGGR